MIGTTWSGGSSPEAEARVGSGDPRRASFRCPDRDWLRQAAVLIQFTYRTRLTVPPEMIKRGMEYGATLRSNHNLLVQEGRLPSGIEGPDGPLAKWGIYLADNGTTEQFDEIAAEVISGCS